MTNERSQKLEKIAEYLSFAQEQPHLFENPRNGGFSILLNKDEIQQVEAEMSLRLVQQGLRPEWSQIGIQYRDQYLTLLRDAVRFPDGELGTYIRITSHERFGPGVAILPLMQGKILLARHYRHATRSWHLEIPRGFGNKSSDLNENAQRELLEEIGVVPQRLVSLGKMHVDTGLLAGLVEVFLAEISTYGQPEKHEAISELMLIDQTEFERLIREEEITDSFTIVAYTRAKLRGLL